MGDGFYGLNGDPFAPIAARDRYFASRTATGVRAQIKGALAAAQGFIVVTGEQGVGKSQLAAHLAATIDRAQMVVAQITVGPHDGDALVRLVAEGFGLIAPGAVDTFDQAAALGAIEAFVRDHARNGQRCVLIIDDAQQMSVAALGELCLMAQFRPDAPPLMQAVLLGQPALIAVLDTPAFAPVRDRISMTVALAPFDPDEVGAYIDHRLTHAGWQGHPALADGVVAALAMASGGVPHRINRLASRALRRGAALAARVIETALVDDVIADVADLDRELARRDAVIATLHQRLAELGDRGVSADHRARITSLEARSADQDEAMRHMLTMLIEWIEAENSTAKSSDKSQ